jgi:serine/threonine-protein kinase RsbT
LKIEKSETLPLTGDEHIVHVRQAVRQRAIELGFRLVDQTKIVTAASEIARNTIIYGGGGACTIETLNNDVRRGLKLVFEDKGPGIANLDLAMKDGYTTGNGLGLGLSGTKRLVNEFDIQSKVGEGTRISFIKWQ